MKRSLQLLRNQAERVELGARYVMYTDIFGNVKDVRMNRKPRVNVLAVIGPAIYGEEECKKIVLLEIGLRNGRPYHRASLGKRGAQKEFNARLKQGTIDLPFLKNIWGALEETLCYDAGQQSSLRYGSSFDRHSRMYLKGVSFSVSASDPVLFAAVIQSELKSRFNPLLEDMRRASQWLEKKLGQYNHFAQMAEEAHHPYNALIRLVREGGKERRGKKFAEDLFAAENFLHKRALMPHQGYLLGKCRQHLAAFPVSAILSREMPTLLQEDITKWGALLEMGGGPTFTSAYIYCKRETPSHKEKIPKKTARAMKSAPGNYLTFFLTPRGLVKRNSVYRKTMDDLAHGTIPFPIQGVPF